MSTVEQSGRAARVASQIQRQLALIFQNEIQDPRLQFVTISDVRMNRDLSVAKVYVTRLTLEESDDDALLKALAQAQGRIRTLLAKRLTLRLTPNLQFNVDHLIEKSNRLEALIDQAMQMENKSHDDEDKSR